mmetsp:Transcript_24697/g.69320  ORF Transcript_24697/g.69320 Transcript_24697/m.69320 type:complete len:254 (+) Transcript_24697:345-1106(+)
MPNSQHEDIPGLVAFVDGIMQQRRVEHHHVPVQPLLGFVTDRQSALVLAIARDFQCQVRRENEVGEVRVLLDGGSRIHAGKEHLRHRHAAVSHRLGRRREQVGVVCIPTATIHENQRLPTHAVRRRILRQRTGPNVVALLLQFLHIAGNLLEFFADGRVLLLQVLRPIEIVHVPKWRDAEARNVRMAFLNHVALFSFVFFAKVLFVLVALVEQPPRCQHPTYVLFIEPVQQRPFHHASEGVRRKRFGRVGQRD